MRFVRCESLPLVRPSQLLLKRVTVSRNDIIRHSLQELCVSRNWEECARSAAPVVYTPLHGVGWAYVQAAFAHATGLPSPVVVPEQAEPDASFPTTPFPNPEEGQGVWDLAHRTGALAMRSWQAVSCCVHLARATSGCVGWISCVF